MCKIADLPVKTRLPASAWAFAALVTLFSLVSTLVAPQAPSHQTAQAARQPVHHAMVTPAWPAQVQGEAAQ